MGEFKLPIRTRRQRGLDNRPVGITTDFNEGPRKPFLDLPSLPCMSSGDESADDQAPITRHASGEGA